MEDEVVTLGMAWKWQQHVTSKYDKMHFRRLADGCGRRLKVVDDYMSPNVEESRADFLQERMSAHVQGCAFVANDREDRPLSATYSPLPQNLVPIGSEIKISIRNITGEAG